MSSSGTELTACCVHMAGLALSGILIGTLTMELGGHVTINCMKTGYKCELEFKLKVQLFSGRFLLTFGCSATRVCYLYRAVLFC